MVKQQQEGRVLIWQQSWKGAELLLRVLGLPSSESPNH